MSANEPPAASIVVRTAVDWTKMTAAAFGAQTDKLRPLKFITHVAQEGGLELWDSVFRIDFFEFRHQLQTIAADNLAAVTDARVLYGIDEVDWEQTDDEILYPVDDDDLFRPDLVARTSLAAHQNVTMWPAMQRRAEQRGAVLDLMPARVLFTNNGGLRRSFLQDRLSRKAASRVLADHCSATSAVQKLTGVAAPADGAAWYECSLEHPSVAFTLDRCSVSIKHPAALTSLYGALMSDDPAGTLRNLVGADPVAYSDEMAWSRPWVTRIEELLRGALR